MLRVGLTGGLASGKSHVGQYLAELGCHLIRADDLGHQVLMPDGEAYQAVVREFGRGILRKDGAIDRRLLARQVFGRPERLAALNNLVHPPVLRMEEELMAAAVARDPRGIAVVEAAILIETGGHKRFDRLVLAVCEPGQQIERAMRRDGLTRAEVLERLASQMPLEEKRQYAHYIVDTSGGRQETLEQVRGVYESLRSIVEA